MGNLFPSETKLLPTTTSSRCDLWLQSFLVRSCDYLKVLPRKCTTYLKLNTFWTFVPENYSFMPIFSPSSTTDQRCGTQQMQILSNHWSERYIRTLKAILLKTTTLAISDYNFLSILPLKERLNKTREFWYTMLCPEKSHPLLRQSPYTNHDIVESSITY